MISYSHNWTEVYLLGSLTEHETMTLRKCINMKLIAPNRKLAFLSVLHKSSILNIKPSTILVIWTLSLVL